MKRLAVLALLIAAVSGSVHAQTPSGGYSSPASSSSSASFSSLTSGTNTNTGAFTFQQAGTFTSGQFNETHQYILNGGGTTGNTCPGNYHIGGASSVTDAVAGCAYTPSSGVTNSFTDAIAGYVQVNDPNQGGQFGKVEGVSGYFVATCAANNTKCLGIAPQVADLASETGTFLEGMELSVTAFNNSTQGFGILMTVAGSNNQPVADTLPAVQIQTPTGTGTYTSGFDCGSGSVANFHCMEVGADAAVGPSKDSQQITFTMITPGNVVTTQELNLSQDGMMTNTSTGWYISNPTGIEANEIALKATATLSPNQLVKIDTANADSVVVTAITDTTGTFGFVEGNNGATGLCTVGVTFCQINTMPGSKVSGIVGTGTCSIGNQVIVDTTTAGRVKCQAAIPAQGAWVGTALSAQGSVGGLVDILTRFQ